MSSSEQTEAATDASQPMRHCCFSGCQMVTCNACGGQFCVRFQMHVCRPTKQPKDQSVPGSS